MAAVEFPGMDAWLREMKADPSAGGVGMYLAHNGVVRAFSRDGRKVASMDLTYDETRLNEVLASARGMKGISMVRAWLNSGHLEIGDDIMYVMVAGDIRPNVLEALTTLVGTIKSEVVQETEIRPA
ncbi:MAG: molybdenum cofactor biosynthesis protein MoaE [Actinomycetota bacterium]|jgi:molybdopterin synthase catalytic subunit|nr:molybdenum cofactor biosynthesis protein MoaE [Actinomycetota bacterium]